MPAGQVNATSTLPAPSIFYAYATRFEDDPFAGRRALDRHDAFVTTSALTLTVRALPEANRPADFTGAVGEFVVSADAAPRIADFDDVIRSNSGLYNRAS